MTLSEEFLESYKVRNPKWGFDALGWVVYKRTYARPLADGGTEEWWQTVQRVVEGVYEVQENHCEKNGLPWSISKAQRSARRMYDLIFNFKFLPPGRGLWAMGTDYVRQRGSAALNNCAFISTEDLSQDFSYPFCFLMDMSMMGVGVGSDTRGAGSVAIQEPKISGEVHVVEDSREGWVDATRIVLLSFTGVNPLPVFDFSQIRPANQPIKGFGGISPGPRPLQLLLQSITEVLMRRVGALVTSTDIVDVFNLIGRAVVSGGIRRTAEIMLGQPDDEDFRALKDPEKHPEALISHRWASNNSLMVVEGEDYSQFTDQIMKNGEPGFFWFVNARRFGRMKDQPGSWDPGVMGINPCGEIALESGELCNLVEVYPAHHESSSDFRATLKYAYLYAKTVSLMPTHNLRTNAVIGRNRRVGVSVSGVTQALSKFGTRRFLNILDGGYGYLRNLDTQYSRWLCVPNSIKITTVKPSGTVSLLAGATPGVHRPHSEYYIRNVRFDPYSTLLPVLKEAGYPVEPSVLGDGTIIVSFPVHEKFYTKGKRDITMWEQFELAAQMQYWWADNSVSVTVTVKKEEAPSLADALSFYEGRLKSVSILPLDDHGYQQAPYIEITKERYLNLLWKIKAVDKSKVGDVHDIEEAGCTTDVCSII